MKWNVKWLDKSFHKISLCPHSRHKTVIGFIGFFPFLQNSFSPPTFSPSFGSMGQPEIRNFVTSDFFIHFYYPYMSIGKACFSSSFIFLQNIFLPFFSLWLFAPTLHPLVHLFRFAQSSLLCPTLTQFLCSLSSLSFSSRRLEFWKNSKETARDTQHVLLLVRVAMCNLLPCLLSTCSL